MKLQNKKTGDIGDIAQTSADCIIVYYPIVDGVATNPQKRAIYNSLAQLNEEWRDYETREGFKDFIKLNKCFVVGFYDEKTSTKEFEKARAWKRLKDKGFRFTGFSGGSTFIEFTFDKPGEPGSAYKDLELLFGGEE